MPRAFKVSRAVQRWLKQGLEVSPEQLEAFRPDAADIAIARVMSEGLFDPEPIARELASYDGDVLPPLDRALIKRRLAEPVRAAWLNLQVLAAMPRKAAEIYWRLAERAVAGQVDAARLFLTRFDPAYRPTTRRESVSAHLDVRTLTDEDMKRQIADKIKNLFPSTTTTPVDISVGGSTTKKEGAVVVDAEFEVADGV